MRTGAITELQRLTVSLRGGFEPQERYLLFHFTGQLDAYSERQFRDFVSQYVAKSKLPLVLDLSKVDFLEQTVKLVRLEAFLNLQPDLTTALSGFAAQ